MIQDRVKAQIKELTPRVKAVGFWVMKHRRPLVGAVPTLLSAEPLVGLLGLYPDSVTTELAMNTCRPGPYHRCPEFLADRRGEDDAPTSAFEPSQ